MEQNIKSGNECVCVGFLLPTAQNVVYDFYGKWQDGSRGKQFAVEKYEEEIPTTKEGIIGFLSSGILSGVGKKTASDIYDFFGQDSINIIEKSPDELLIIPGMTKKKVSKMTESYTSNVLAKNLILSLIPFNIPIPKCIEIYKRGITFSLIQLDPFCLMAVPRISFDSCDLIRHSMGLPIDMPSRIKAGILHTLFLNELKGSTSIKATKAVNNAAKILGISSAVIEGHIKMMISDKNIVAISMNKECYLYLPKTAEAEKIVAKSILSLMAPNAHLTPSTADIINNIREYEDKKSIHVAPEQEEAITMALSNKLSIITGGPGTGKTTIIDFITNIYKLKNPRCNILLCAPTGLAARRLSASTSMSAYTIHKVMDLSADDDEEYTESSVIDCDLLIIDEMSMVGLKLAKALFSSINSRCKVVLVGDRDQLPSIDAGSVFGDLIDCGIIPSTQLKTIYRQKYGSNININAKKINSSQTDLIFDESFSFVKAENCSEAVSPICSLFVKSIEEYGLDNVTILSPFRVKTDTGTVNLNKEIQSIINPAGKSPSIKHGSYEFRVGDKVMQTKNTKDICNGDIGYITKIDLGESPMVYVSYGDGRIGEYSPLSLDILSLAYAMTIHKSQGSEFAVVILNIQNEHSSMLRKNLLYTAVTRAKRKAIIVGSRVAVDKAIISSTSDGEKRITFLSPRLLSLKKSGV